MIVYKVVSKNLCSVDTYNPILRKQYTLGKWSYANRILWKHNCGLFVFRYHRDAKLYRRRYPGSKILGCEAIGIRKEHIEMMRYMVREDIKEVTEGLKHLINAISPFGTLSCWAIKPMEIIS